jgi:hypothetical protein
MLPEIIGSPLRKTPLPGKPHIYLDGIWVYSLPKGLNYSYINAAGRAYRFIKKLNKARFSSRRHKI